MIRDWYRMKREEIKMKLVIYSYINKFMGNKKEIIETVLNTISAFKDSSPEEIQEKFITALAEIVHESKEE